MELIKVNKAVVASIVTMRRPLQLSKVESLNCPAIPMSNPNGIQMTCLGHPVEYKLAANNMEVQYCVTNGFRDSLQLLLLRLSPLVVAQPSPLETRENYDCIVSTHFLGEKQSVGRGDATTAGVLLLNHSFGYHA